MESPRDVEKLSAEVERLAFDWRRMRTVVERIAKMEWWDLRTLCCLFCHAPFDVATGDCKHEVDCVYERSCQITGIGPRPIPNEAILEEWGQPSRESPIVRVRPGSPLSPL
jgi:hypothetical protein